MAGGAHAFLKALPVFATLPAKEVESLSALAREEPYRARDYVFMEGDPARWLCLVKTGRVRIVRHSPPGRTSCSSSWARARSSAASR